MSLLRSILVGIGLLSLNIPFNVCNAQFKITSSEGTKVIGKTNPSASSNSETKENWTRTYAPGEQEREYQETVEKEKKERQTAVERKANEKNTPKEKKLEVKRKG